MYLISALLCSILWSAVTVGSKTLSGALPSFLFAFLRYGLAAVCLVPFIRVTQEQKESAKLYLPHLLFLGFALVLMFNMLFFNALYYSSATSISLIMATNPIVTMIVTALLYRHVPNRYQLAAFMLSFAGATLVITEGKVGLDALKGSIGDIFMLGGVLFQVCYALTLKSVSSHFLPLFLSFATLISGIMFVFPFVVNYHSLEILMHLTVTQWSIIILISSFGTAWPLYLYAIAIRDIGPAKTNLIIFSSMPLFVSVLAYGILGEAISVWQIVGGVLVVSSLAIGLPHTRTH